MTSRLLRSVSYLLTFGVAVSSGIGSAWAAPPVAEAPAAAPNSAAAKVDVKPAAPQVAAAAKFAEQGCRVFICGHSFHIFNAQYLVPLCKAAGLAKHEIVGRQMIGGSSVTQHWELPADKNRARKRSRPAKSTC
ncbi:MAG: hypothetical protein QM775_02185 [Pirellulales bacterium]